MATMNFENIKNVELMIDFKNRDVKRLSTYEYEMSDLLEFYHAFLKGEAVRYTLVDEAGTRATIFLMSEIQFLEIHELF